MIKPKPKKSSSIDDITKNKNNIVFTSEYMRLRFKPITSNIIRVTATGDKDFNEKPSPGICCKESGIGFKISNHDSYFELSTKNIFVRIFKSDSSTKYYDNSGRELFSVIGLELEQFGAMRPLPKKPEEIKYIETPDGKKPIAENIQKVFYKHLYKSKLLFEFNENEAVYGFGQYTEGKLNIRNSVRYIHHGNMQTALPLMVSTNGYGILFDMYCPMIFDDTKSKPYLYAEGSDELDFYFIKGNPNEVIAGYRYLSGKASLLPKWAYGYLQSMERYETQDELINVLKEYRKRRLGIDGIILDWMSWQGNNWGDKNLDPNRFPSPEKMTQKIHEMKGHLMVSIWPNMDSGQNHDEMESRKFFLPNSTIYNAFLPEARKLYWNQVSEGLFSKGVDAFWCDSSEPLVPEWGHLIEPPAAVAYKEYIDTFENCTTIDIANAYSLHHCQSVYNGMHNEKKRAFTLTRSAYIGQQRYGTVLWSGDISAKWDVLKKQIAEGLSMSASGYPWWTLDIGGFFTKQGKEWYWNGDFNDGASDLGYRELYVRWYQYAVFLPIFRAHGTDTRREMWAFGDEGTLFYDILVKYNRLRYKLMPTIYSIAGMVWKHDASFFSPLSFIFYHDANVYNIKDQFMVGDSIMVCPVTDPMYYKPGSIAINNVSKTRKVYLPQGIGWYDFHTNKHYDGGQIITVNAELDIIPVFIRDGAIILTGHAIEYTNHNSEKPITINIYPGQDGYFELYEDSGDGYSYENGDYTITKIKWSDSSKTLNISPENYKKNKFNINIIRSKN